MFNSRQITNFYQMLSAGTALDHAASTTVTASCSPSQAAATAQAIAATNRLSNCLSQHNPTLKDVMQHIDDKNAAAERYLNSVGVHWPL